MAKIIVVSETKAYKIEAIKISGEKYISIRQMYRSKKQADEDEDWNHGKQGITLPVDEETAVKIARRVGKMAQSEDTKYKTLDLDKPKKGKGKKGRDDDDE